MIEFAVVFIAIMQIMIFVGLACINFNLRSYKLFDPNAPTNAYGEGLVDGIQNAHARGLRGIATYD